MELACFWGGSAPRSRDSSVGANAGVEALVPTEESLIRRVQAPIQEWVNFTSSLSNTAERDLRERYEGTVEPEEYARRFPDLRDTLARQSSSANVATRIAGPTPSSSVDPPWPQVPGYEIVEQLGRGGMGIVYKAREADLERHVALKFLPAEFTESPDRLDRFLREVRTASALNHPHICTIHALDQFDGRPFIEMEWIDGEEVYAIYRPAQRGSDDAA